MLTLNIELADNPISRAYGLMDRKSLNEDDGMLFIFPEKHTHGFWMKNTHIPLDIAFIDDAGKIFQIATMHPSSSKFTHADNPCRYAIEVNAGWFAKNKIDIGHQIFSGREGIREIKRNGILSYSRGETDVRIAQVVVRDDNEEDDSSDEPNEIDGNLTPEQDQLLDQEIGPYQEEWQNPQQEQPQEPYQPSPDTQYNLDNVQKIKQAELDGKELDIVYWTLSGKTLPPRRLIPLEGEGYPIKFGPNGRRFTGYDVSPTINGNGWQIKGMTPKNFLTDNIISLEVIDKGEVQENVEQEEQYPQQQQPQQSQNWWDKIKNIFNR